MRFAILFFCVWPVCCGCTHTATVQTWVPASIDVSGMNRIAVIGFSGDNGPAVATSLNSHLWENGFYDMVDGTSVQSHILPAGYETADPINPKAVLGPARQAGIDGVVLGEVVEYRCDDQRYNSSHVHFGTDKHEDEFGSSSSTGFGIETNSRLERDGTVSVAFKLVDTRTGKIRAAKTVSHHFHGEIVNGEGTIPSQGEVLEILTQKCLDEIVSMMAPHQQSTRLRLARCDYWTKGRSEVNQGVKLAEKGQWDEADRLWERALEINSANHAATYNRALAAAARHNYGASESLAMDALKIQHKGTYAAGLDAIRKYRATYETAQQQKVQSQIVTDH